MDPAAAFLKYGSITGPVSGIGFTLGPGSWPVYDAKEATTRRPICRNPNLIDESARWPGIESWKARRLTHSIFDWLGGIAEAAKQVAVPWNPKWAMVGGTQPQSADNGIIIVDGDVRWEMQGLRYDGAQWRVDAMARITPGMPVRGSQGPWSKLDGLLRPKWLDGPWTGPVRLVGFNVSWGPMGIAVPGAWVEHPGKNIPYPKVPTDQSLNVPCGQVLRFDITDDAREQWLTDTGVKLDSALARAKRWGVIGLREHGMRLSESGSGYPILESSGGANPTELAKYRDVGVSSERIANQFFAGLWPYGKLYAA